MEDPFDRFTEAWNKFIDVAFIEPFIIPFLDKLNDVVLWFDNLIKGLK